MAKKKEEIKTDDFLSAFDKMINSEFGSDVVRDLSKEDTDVPYWIDTGNLSLNYACSKSLRGGIPGGRITNLSGLSGCGKSLIMATLIKDPQIDRCVCFSCEGSGISNSLFDFVGCTEEQKAKVKFIPVSTFKSYKISKESGNIEEVSDKELPSKLDTPSYVYKLGLITIIKRVLDNLQYTKNKAKVLFLIDGFNSLMSIRKLQNISDMGGTQKDSNLFFDVIDNAIEKTNAAVVFTTKLYTNFGNEYDPWIVTGGQSVVYNPSLSIMLTALSASEDLSDAQIKEEKARRKTALGNSYITVRANIKKSRFSTNGKNAHILINSNFGIVKFSGLFEMLHDYGLAISPSKGYYSIPGIPGLDGNFRKQDFIKLFKERESEYIPLLEELLHKREEELKIDGEVAEINDLGDAVASGVDEELTLKQMATEMEVDTEMLAEEALN